MTHSPARPSAHAPRRDLSYAPRPHRCVRRWATTGIAVAALTLASAGCGGSSSSGSGQTKLTVLAASSLTEAFDKLAKIYDKAHPGVEVSPSYDSSAILAQQVTQGSKADVLATADPATMAMVTKAGDAVGKPTTFVTNSLVLVTPPDNPGKIADISDLAKPGVKFADCVIAAPCGAAAAALLKLDKVSATPVTQEENVKDTLTQVTSGNVDAGFVYVTDAMSAGSTVHTVVPTNATKVINDYPIAVLKNSAHQADARAWVKLVESAQGQQILKSYGFVPAAG